MVRKLFCSPALAMTVVSSFLDTTVDDGDWGIYFRIVEAF